MHKSSGLGRLIYYFLTDWPSAIHEIDKLNQHDRLSVGPGLHQPKTFIILAKVTAALSFLKLITTACLGALMLCVFYAGENITGKFTAAVCNGYTPCKACSDCKHCKFCKNGGTCGICKKENHSYKSKVAAAASIQCKALTRKGTRCKRTAIENGYCRLHG